MQIFKLHLSGQRQVQVVKAGKLSKDPAAPDVFKIVQQHEAASSSSDAKSIFDELWGGALFADCERGSVVPEFETDYADSGVASEEKQKQNSGAGPALNKRQRAMQAGEQLLIDAMSFEEKLMSDRMCSITNQDTMVTKPHKAKLPTTTLKKHSYMNSLFIHFGVQDLSGAPR